jgi:hypothetical protein
MSALLPWNGGIAPFSSDKLQTNRDINQLPPFLSCSKNLATYFLNSERKESNTIDGRNILKEYLHLNSMLQYQLAISIGLPDANELI